MLSEAIARKAIGVEGAAVLIEIIEGAWSDHLAEGRLRTSWTRASIVWDYMAARGRQDLGAMEGVRTVVRFDRPMFALRDRLLLRFKKHSRDLETRNYPTPSQIEVAEQGAFTEYPWPTVGCGYVLDRAQAGIESLVVSNHVDGWSIDLRDLAAGNLTPVTQMLDVPGYVDDLDQVQPIRRLG